MKNKANPDCPLCHGQGIIVKDEFQKNAPACLLCFSHYSHEFKSKKEDVVSDYSGYSNQELQAVLTMRDAEIDAWKRWKELIVKGDIALRKEVTEALFDFNKESNEILQNVVEELNEYQEAAEDHKRLVREIDEIINGKEGMAKQASLCDIVAQIKSLCEEYEQLRKRFIDLSKCNEQNVLEAIHSNAELAALKSISKEPSEDEIFTACGEWWEGLRKQPRQSEQWKAAIQWYKSQQANKE